MKTAILLCIGLLGVMQAMAQHYDPSRTALTGTVAKPAKIHMMDYNTAISPDRMPEEDYRKSKPGTYAQQMRHQDHMSRRARRIAVREERRKLRAERRALSGQLADRRARFKGYRGGH